MAQAALKVVQQNEPDQAAIDAVNLSRVRAAQEAFHSQNGELRSVFARAAAMNLNLPAAKRALKILKSGKSEEFIAETERTVFYLKLLGKPVNEDQLDMFVCAPSSAPEDEKAGEEGLSAGRMGQEENQNPYDLGSPKGQAWLKRFRDGLAECNLVLSMPEPKIAEAEGDEEDE